VKGSNPQFITVRMSFGCVQPNSVFRLTKFLLNTYDPSYLHLDTSMTAAVLLVCGFACSVEMQKMCMRLWSSHNVSSEAVCGWFLHIVLGVLMMFVFELLGKPQTNGSTPASSCLFVLLSSSAYFFQCWGRWWKLSYSVCVVVLVFSFCIIPAWSLSIVDWTF